MVPFKHDVARVVFDERERSRANDRRLRRAAGDVLANDRGGRVRKQRRVERKRFVEPYLDTLVRPDDEAVDRELAERSGPGADALNRREHRLQVLPIPPDRSLKRILDVVRRQRTPVRKVHVAPHCQQKPAAVVQHLEPLGERQLDVPARAG